MTKADVMANWDAIVCDPALSLGRVSAHLDRVVASGPELLDDTYLVLATGGSTGTRGVFVWDLADFTEHMAASGRAAVWNARRRSNAADQLRRAVVFGGNPVHLSYTLAWLVGTEIRSAGTPLAELVEWLNELQPDSLGGYASILGRLAEETLSGRLAISPLAVDSLAEPADERLRDRIARAWGCPLTNVYGLTEAPAIAVSYENSSTLTLHDDIAIIEVVNADGQPTSPGEVGERILVTTLTNRTLPLVRYEVTDQLALLDGPVDDRRWTGPLISPPVGRADDWFRWSNGIEVHPHVIRSALVKEPAVVEYTVHQTREGIDLTIVAAGELDAESLRHHLTAALSESGMEHPQVAVTLVDNLPRHHQSSKLKRFVPLEN